MYPDHSGDLRRFREHLKSKAAVITPLKKWELQDLSLQASTLIMQSDDPLATLQHTSEDFPVLAAQVCIQRLQQQQQQ